MRKVFGSASDFFEVKLYFIQEMIPQEFDWDELTAYIGPRTPMEPEKNVKYEIQFIDRMSGRVVKRLEFKEATEARLKYEEIIDDLRNKEVMDFAEKYEISVG